MIGLCGAHRTGKTTLARAFAEKHDMEFVQTSASEVFKEFGLNPATRYAFDTRLSIQEEILKRFDKQYAEVGLKPAITDRTPLDMLAYTMAEATQDHVPEELQARFKKYVQNCIDVTNKRFGVLLVVQPGIKIVAEEGKAALNEAYIEHLNSIILGLSVDERIKAAHFYIPRYMTDKEERLAALDFAVNRAGKRAEAERESAVLH
jgi:hypothetical protein